MMSYIVGSITTRTDNKYFCYKSQHICTGSQVTARDPSTFGIRIIHAGTTFSYLLNYADKINILFKYLLPHKNSHFLLSGAILTGASSHHAILVLFITGTSGVLRWGDT